MPSIDPIIVTLLMFGAMLVLMAMGAPLVFCLSIVGMAAGVLLWGVNGAEMAVVSAFGLMNTFVLVALPLFIFMGLVLESSGIADNLFGMFHKVMGGLNGGLGMGTVIICAMIAAMAGVSGAATVSLGIIALPAMLIERRRRNLEAGPREPPVRQVADDAQQDLSARKPLEEKRQRLRHCVHGVPAHGVAHVHHQ